MEYRFYSLGSDCEVRGRHHEFSAETDDLALQIAWEYRATVLS